MIRKSLLILTMSPLLVVASDLEVTMLKKKLYMKDLMGVVTYMLATVAKNEGINDRKSAGQFAQDLVDPIGELYNSVAESDRDFSALVFKGCSLEESIIKIISILYIKEYIDVQNLKMSIEQQNQ